ncbi:MAG: hypothetical protein KIT56_02820 [Gammaproteobacteria bacterium]|nr:hypothetical protein [Gammaproteobacteria bacterium]MCW5582810.1 hypothetical protein [Gammaproteobacteria bacterium]
MLHNDKQFEARYVIRPSNPLNISDDYLNLLNYIQFSKAYKNPYSRIRIEGHTIYFGCSLREIKASLPELPSLLMTWIGAHDFREGDVRNNINKIRDLIFEVKFQYEDEQNKVLSQAEKELPQSDISSLINPSETDIFTALEKCNGIIIGDGGHQSKSAKKFIIDNMSQLKSLGLTTLCLEHVFSDTMQEMLDAYIQSESEVMPIMLYDYLRMLDSEYGLLKANDVDIQPYCFTGLVMQAKRYNIRILAIDTAAVYEILPWISYLTAKRILAMNHHAGKVVKESIQPTDKAIVFCGSTHLYKYDDGVPGISSFIPWPSVTVTEQKYLPKLISKNDLYSSSSLTIDVSEMTQEAKDLDEFMRESNKPERPKRNTVFFFHEPANLQNIAERQVATEVTTKVEKRSQNDGCILS